MVDRITATDLKALQDTVEEFTLVDTRSEEDYRQHKENASELVGRPKIVRDGEWPPAVRPSWSRNGSSKMYAIALPARDPEAPMRFGLKFAQEAAPSADASVLERIGGARVPHTLRE